jgi:hypothetical protein
VVGDPEAISERFRDRRPDNDKQRAIPATELRDNDDHFSSPGRYSSIWPLNPWRRGFLSAMRTSLSTISNCSGREVSKVLETMGFVGVDCSSRGDGLMRTIFQFARRWELIEKNPIGLVRVKGSSKRLRAPRVLTSEQFCLLPPLLIEPYRTQVSIAGCLGLRASEIVPLRWSDFNFDDRTLLAQRSMVHGRLDDVKTEYSRDYVPLDAALIEVLERTERGTIRPKKTGCSRIRRRVGPTIKTRFSSITFDEPAKALDLEIGSAGTLFGTAIVLGSTTQGLRLRFRRS